MLSWSRTALLIPLLLSAPALGQQQNTSTYPSQTVEIIVPAAAGGPADIAARLLAEFLRTELNGSVIVENRPGAGGNTGSAYVARSNPSGYILLGIPDSISSNAVLYKNIGFDLFQDLAPVAMYGVTSPTVLVRPQLGAKTMKDFLEIAKTRKEPVRVGNAGVGTTGHLLSAFWQIVSGVKWIDVPYRGGGPAVIDLLGGQIDAFIGPAPAGLLHVKAGTLHSLGVMAPNRLAALPEVATVREQGIPELETANWVAVFAPAKIPAPIVERLSKAIERFTTQPEYAARLAKTGFEARFAGPEQFRDIVKSTTAKWAEVFKRAGLSQL